MSPAVAPRRLRSGAHIAGSGHERWMISYMDIVTILLILFVALAAQALQHPKKIVAAAPPPIANAVPVPPRPRAVPPPRSALLETQEKLREQGLDSRLEPRGLVVSLPQTVLFASGDDRISGAAEPIVAKLAGVLRDLPNRVNLIGHADSLPIHNSRFRNNWELSAARGLQLLELLTRKYEIPEERLSVASDGSYDPASSNDTAEGRAVNRRVEIVILDDPKPVGPMSGLEANRS